VWRNLEYSIDQAFPGPGCARCGRLRAWVSVNSAAPTIGLSSTIENPTAQANTVTISSITRFEVNDFVLHCEKVWDSKYATNESREDFEGSFSKGQIK